MKISDETLMGFADDEVDAATRADVEAAMRDDPGIGRRIDEHRALRARLQKAFAQELDEEPPERLVAAARGASALRTETNVVSLDAVRARMARPIAGTVYRTAWLPAAAIAASLLIGVALGTFVFDRSSPVTLKQSAGLIASGALATALSSTPGSAVDSSGTVRLGVSFLAKSGIYCRSFTLTASHAPAGLACRDGDAWQIQAWTESSEGVASGAGSQDFRTAGSALPPELVGAVAARISGDPLDSKDEATALQRGWQLRAKSAQ